MNKALISARAITKRYHLSYQTVNYYTNLGFFMVKERKGNSRFYHADEIRRCLNKITKLKNHGYSLKLIRDILRKEK